MEKAVSSTNQCAPETVLGKHICISYALHLLNFFWNADVAGNDIIYCVISKEQTLKTKYKIKQKQTTTSIETKQFA